MSPERIWLGQGQHVRRPTVQAKDYFLKLLAVAILEDEPVAVFAELDLSPLTVDYDLNAGHVVADDSVETKRRVTRGLVPFDLRPMRAWLPATAPIVRKRPQADRICRGRYRVDSALGRTDD